MYNKIVLQLRHDSHNRMQFITLRITLRFLNTLLTLFLEDQKVLKVLDTVECSHVALFSWMHFIITCTDAKQLL